MNTSLHIAPKSWFSWDFAVLQGAEPVAIIDISMWREKGILTVQGEDYAVGREGLMSGNFTLEHESTVLAEARKPSSMKREYEIDCLGQKFTLGAKSSFGREFVLKNDAHVVGSIRPQSILTRRATVELPEELPLPVQVFMIWLTVILWKRAADSSSS